MLGCGYTTLVQLVESSLTLILKVACQTCLVKSLCVAFSTCSPLEKKNSVCAVFKMTLHFGVFSPTVCDLL